MKATAVGGPAAWRMDGRSPVPGATRWESSSGCVAVYDRAVLLTMTERRRLWREWGEADNRAHAGSAS